MCVRTCVRACVRPWVPGRVSVCIFLLAFSLAYRTCNGYAPFSNVICGPFSSAIFFNIIS